LATRLAGPAWASDFALPREEPDAGLALVLRALAGAFFATLDAVVLLALVRVAGLFAAAAFLAGAFVVLAALLRVAGALAALGVPALRGRARVSEVAKREQPLDSGRAGTGAWPV